MTTIIHFFRERIKERLDYEKLIAYFDELEQCKIFYNDDYVELVMHDAHFDFSYSFLITKRSRVQSIYNLNGNFVNLNLLVEFPLLLPEVVVRDILKFINDLCQLFEMEIYYNGAHDIESFDLLQMLNFLSVQKMHYLDEHPEIKQYKLNRQLLNEVCNYYQMLPDITNKISPEVVSVPYTILYDNRNDKVVLSIKWVAGTPMIFPPHLDYITIQDEDNYIFMVPADFFIKKAGRNLYKTDDFLPSFQLLILYGKRANRVKRLNRRFKKAMIVSSNFSIIKITDLIED